MTDDAHAFRGEYIDLCAHVERWATVAMHSEAAVKTSLVAKDQRHLFGEKLKIIREISERHPDVFMRSDVVHELMIEFAPFASMRSDLAHATLQRAGHIYAFSMPDSAPPRTGKRFWLVPDDLLRIIDELRDLKKRICDQKLKAAPKASPNLQRRSCPASSSPPASDI